METQTLEFIAAFVLGTYAFIHFNTFILHAAAHRV